MESCDVDYRTAYLVVGRAVRTASREGLRGVDLTGDRLDAAAVEQTGASLGLAGRDLSTVLDPRGIVSTRVAPGGAAPEVVRGMAERCAGDARSVASRAAEMTATYAAAEAELVALAEEVAGGSASPR
jgi:argininosuccinate lyase